MRRVAPLEPHLMPPLLAYLVILFVSLTPTLPLLLDPFVHRVVRSVSALGVGAAMGEGTSPTTRSYSPTTQGSRT